MSGKLHNHVCEAHAVLAVVRPTTKTESSKSCGCHPLPWPFCRQAEGQLIDFTLLGLGRYCLRHEPTYRIHVQLTDITEVMLAPFYFIFNSSAYIAQGAVIEELNNAAHILLKLQS